MNFLDSELRRVNREIRRMKAAKRALAKLDRAMREKGL